MNCYIVRYLSLNGPSLIYQVAKALASESETKVHYPTVNRRVHDLVQRNYLMIAGTRKTRAGAEASVYATTIRGDFASLASDLSTHDQFRLVQMAGQKPNSPFMLLKLMTDRGLGFDFVRREFLGSIADDVMNGYINIEALNEDVICSAFATSMARKMRAVLGDDKGKEYLQNILSILESLVSPAPRQAPKKDLGPREDVLMRAYSPSMMTGGAGAGATSRTANEGPCVDLVRKPSANLSESHVLDLGAAAAPRLRPTKTAARNRSGSWINDLKQMIVEMSSRAE